MHWSREHETPEAIAAYLTGLIVHVRSYILSNHEQVQAHGLRLLRSLCRAASHGRMPKELRSSYEGVLRSVRPHVMALQRSGVRISAVVLLEVGRSKHRSK